MTRTVLDRPVLSTDRLVPDERRPRCLHRELQQPRVLLSGLAIVESPRWHDGRLWFAHWGDGEIVAVDLDGNSEVVGHGRHGPGWSIDWLPDGRLLVTGPRGSLRREPDGSMVTHADLTGLSRTPGTRSSWTGAATSTSTGSASTSCRRGVRARASSRWSRPDGSVRQVADAIAFPNGMVVTPDNSTLIVAESFAGRLTAFDIARRRQPVEPAGLGRPRRWRPTASASTPRARSGTHGRAPPRCVRVREGGEVLQTIELDRAASPACSAARTADAVHACRRVAAGSPRTWSGCTGARTGQVLTARGARAGRRLAVGPGPVGCGLPQRAGAVSPRVARLPSRWLRVELA